jgi:hypothetical protein
MNKTLKAALGGFAGALLLASIGGAQAAVIVGPTLNIDGAAWTTTGIGFRSNIKTNLMSFVYQNQGAADTIVLTDASGNILDSVNTPAGNTSDTVSVNWALTSGDSYFLLQTVVSNELYASYGAPLPSNSDIAITLSGTFDYSIAGAVANSQNWGSNEYWAAFNNITTSSIPEPSTWAMMMLGFAGLGYAAVRRSSKSHLAASAA